MNSRRVAVALLLAGVVGCKKELSGNAAADGGADAGARGLANSANDAAVVALARAAAGCPKAKPDAPSRAFFDPECPALKSWEKNDLIARSANDPTLLNMLDDAEPGIRWLGAAALFTGGERWGGDKDAAVRVLTATETEKDKLVGYRLGLTSSMIDLKKTGLADRIVALIKDTSRDPGVRLGAVNTLGYNDPAAFPALREAIEGVAKKDDDASLRGSAIRVLSTHKGSVNCPLFLELAHEPEGTVASAAVHALVDMDYCPEQVDPLVAEILRRATAGEANNETFAWALGQLGKAKSLTPAMKTRLVTAAQEIVKNAKNSSLARTRAVDVMIAIDPATKAFVAKYKEDPDVLVATAAKKH